MNILDCWQWLQVAQDTLSTKMEEILKSEEITTREWITLRVLSTQNTASCASHFKMKTLSERIGLSASATGRLVSRLEDQGLLIRYLCPTDRRGIYNDVTMDGREILERVTPQIEALLEELHFPQEVSLETYIRHLEKVVPMVHENQKD